MPKINMYCCVVLFLYAGGHSLCQKQQGAIALCDVTTWSRFLVCEYDEIHRIGGNKLKLFKS